MLNYVSISLSFAYSFLFLLFVEMFQLFLQDLSSINYLVKKISPNLNPSQSNPRTPQRFWSIQLTEKQRTTPNTFSFKKRASTGEQMILRPSKRY